MSVLFTYTALNVIYANGLMRYMGGDEDASTTTPAVGTVNNPVDTAAAIPVNDPVPFSYNYNGALRMLLANISSSGGAASSCVFSRYAPVDPGNWSAGKAENFHILSNNNEVIQNPHGLAQVGERLYTIDWETRRIVIIGTSELENAVGGGNVTLGTAPYNFPPSPAVPLDARGQGIIALSSGGTNYIFALYQRTNLQAGSFNASGLIRLTVNSSTGALGNPSYVTTLAPNAQSIIPVKNGAAEYLLIPSIGGNQKYDGTSNGIASRLEVVTNPFGAMGKQILLTGDDTPNPPPKATVYDIQAVAASSRDGDGLVYILTGVYDVVAIDPDGKEHVYQRKWRLYRTTVSQLLALAGTTYTLSAAVQAGALAVMDEAITNSDSSMPDMPYSIFFWDILYEQALSGANADRLWFARGTPIMATPAGAYGSPTQTAGGSGVYKLFDTTLLGQVNVNGVDLTIETNRQAAQGVSLKRSLRGVSLKGAPRISAAAEEAEEEEK